MVSIQLEAQPEVQSEVQSEVQPEDPPQIQPTSSVFPQFSLAEWATQLNKFEVLLLTPEQVAEFNKHFLDRNITISHPLFDAWLSLKNASLRTESQALKAVIA